MKLISYILLLSLILSWILDQIYLSFGLLAISLILHLIISKKFRIKPIELTLLGFSLTALIPYFRFTPENFWGNYATLVGTFIVFYISTRINLKTHLSLVKNMLLIQISIFFIQLVYLYVENGFLLKYNIGIPFGDSNLIASVSLFNFILLLYWEQFSIKSINIRQLREVLLFGSGVNIVLTQSFTAILILFFFILLWILNRVNWKSKMVVLVTGIMLIIILIPLLEDRTKIGKLLHLMSDEQIELINREREIRAERIQSEFLHGRFEVYGMALKNFTECPLFGKGLGNITDYKNIFSTPTFRAHNLFLELLASSGITGFLLYVSFILLLLRKASTLLRSPTSNEALHRAIAYSMVAVLLHSMVESNFLSFKFAIYVFIPLSILYNPHSQNYAEKIT